ncbi:MAG: type IX secretion system membrane protein PorP/SprF [Cellulophaga sp.]
MKKIKATMIKVLLRSLVLLLVLQVFQVNAQKEPQYTQYMYNIGSFNPAYVGTVETPEITGLYRAQWIGIDGAPRTMRLGVNMPLANEKNGLGFNVVNDQIGPSVQTYIDVAYSFQVQVGDATKLSFGISAGGSLLDVDYSKGLFEVSGDGENVNKFYPTVGAGAFLYSDQWYVGLSVPNFLTGGLYNEVVSKVIEDKFQYNFIGGYVFDISETLKFKPAMLLNYLEGSPVTVNLSSNFLINDLFTVGASYRFGSAVSGLAGFQVSNSMFVGYSYDYNTNGLGEYNSGSHEFIMKFYLGKGGSNERNNKNKKGKPKQIDSPRFF